MKTWRLRLERAAGGPVGFWHAVLRYVLAWLWFLPGLAVASLIGAKGWLLVLIPCANAAIWAALAFLDPQRQFLHDRIARTRLLRLPLTLGKRKRPKAA